MTQPPHHVLHPLPHQPKGVPWPTDAWPTGEAPAELLTVVDEMFADQDQ